MTYIYYPGCSLEASAMEYDASTRAVMKRLGVTLTDIREWNCCGATAAETLSPLLSLCLAARNLALAESMGLNQDILVPCSACYLNLKRASKAFSQEPETRETISEVLTLESLKIKRPPRVRHLLDVLAHDIGQKRITAGVTKCLKGLKIAPYYGCQCLRPYAEFDNPEAPHSMNGLIRACGAEVVNWSMAGACCGASSMNTKPHVAEKLVFDILADAVGADAIVTVCPMCQLNLEGFQSKISHKASRNLFVTVIYLPQLLGLALGCPESEVKLGKNLAVSEDFLLKLS